MKIGLGVGITFPRTLGIVQDLVAPLFNQIPDQNLTTTSGVLQINLASYNVGGPIETFTDISLPTGVTRSGSVISIDTSLTGEVTDATISVQASNAAGSDTATFLLTVTAAALATITMQTSIGPDEAGATYTFSEPVPVVIDAAGRPAVLTTDGPVTITSITPTCVDDATLGIVHGARFDPAKDRDGNAQGFSELHGSVGSSRDVAYSAALNQDPAAPGNGGSVTVPQGADTTLVKAISDLTLSAFSDDKAYTGFSHLTFLSERPLEGFFCPGATQSTKEVEFNVATIDLSVLRSLSAFDGNTQQEALDSIPFNLPKYGWTGQTLRRFGPDDAYSLQWMRKRYPAFRYLMSTASDADKLPVALKVIRAGMEIYSQRKTGWFGGAGAGQHHGYHTYLYFTAFLLQSQTLMQQANTLASNMVGFRGSVDAGTFWWVQDYQEGDSVAYPSSASTGSVYGQTFFSEHVGKPIGITAGPGTLITSRYHEIITEGMHLEMLPTILLQNGPNGLDGLAEVIGGGPFDNTNSAAACVAWMDWTMPCTGVQFKSARYQEWLATRDLCSAPTYKTIPHQVDRSEDVQKFTATDGGFSWNFNGIRGSSEDYELIDIRYSHDLRQWTVLTDQPRVGSVSGLQRGADYYCSFRLKNPHGNMIWSRNFPIVNPRSFITTTGTEADAQPVNTVAPILGVKKYPKWLGPSFEAFSNNQEIAQGDTQILCSTGFWTAFPAVDIGQNLTFQWVRVTDGVSADISGATARSYNRTVDDFSTDTVSVQLKCRVSANNGIGPSVSVETDPILMPLKLALPSNVLVDTDFGGQFPLYYPDLQADTIVINGNKVHDPFAQFLIDIEADGEGDEATTVLFDTLGSFKVDKTDNTPTIQIPIEGVVGGRSYYVEFAVPSEYRVSEGRIYGSTGTAPDTGNTLAFINVEDNTATELLRLIELPASYGQSEFWIHLRNGTVTGGTAGQDSGITSLKVTYPSILRQDDQVIYSNETVKLYLGLNTQSGTYSVSGTGASIDQQGTLTLVGQAGQTAPISYTVTFTPDTVGDVIETVEFNVTHLDASVYWTPDQIHSDFISLFDTRIGLTASGKSRSPVTSLEDQAPNPATATPISGSPKVIAIGGTTAVQLEPGSQMRSQKTYDMSGNPPVFMLTALRGAAQVFTDFADDLTIAGANRAIKLSTRVAVAFYNNGNTQFVHSDTEFSAITSFQYKTNHDNAQLWRNGVALAKSAVSNPTNDISDFANETITTLLGDENANGLAKTVNLLHMAALKSEPTTEVRQKYEGYVAQITGFPLDPSHPWANEPPTI